MNKFFRGLLLMASAATLAISFNACGDDDNVTPDETTGGSSAGSTSKGLVTKDATKVEFFSAVLNGYYIGKEDENYMSSASSSHPRPRHRHSTRTTDSEAMATPQSPKTPFSSSQRIRSSISAKPTTTAYTGCASATSPTSPTAM